VATFVAQKIVCNPKILFNILRYYLIVFELTTYNQVMIIFELNKNFSFTITGT